MSTVIAPAVVYVGELSFRGEVLVTRRESEPGREWSGDLRVPYEQESAGTPPAFEWGCRSAGATTLAAALVRDASGLATEPDQIARMLDVLERLPSTRPAAPPAAISGETIEHGWAECWRLTREEVLVAAMRGAVAHAMHRLEHGPQSVRREALTMLLDRAARDSVYSIDGMHRDLRVDLPVRLATALPMLDDDALLDALQAHYRQGCWERGEVLLPTPTPLVRALQRMAARPASQPGRTEKARHLMTDLRISWLEQAGEAAQIDAIERMAREPARYEWMAWAIYREGPKLAAAVRALAVEVLRSFLSGQHGIGSRAAAVMTAELLGELSDAEVKAVIARASDVEAVDDIEVIAAAAEGLDREAAWTEAMDRLIGVMSDPGVDPNTRLSAALLAVRRASGARFDARRQMLERIAQAAALPPLGNHSGLRRELRRLGLVPRVADEAALREALRRGPAAFVAQRAPVVTVDVTGEDEQAVRAAVDGQGVSGPHGGDKLRNDAAGALYSIGWFDASARLAAGGDAAAALTDLERFARQTPHRHPTTQARIEKAVEALRALVADHAAHRRGR